MHFFSKNPFFLLISRYPDSFFIIFFTTILNSALEVLAIIFLINGITFLSNGEDSFLISILPPYISENSSALVLLMFFVYFLKTILTIIFLIIQFRKVISIYISLRENLFIKVTNMKIEEVQDFDFGLAMRMFASDIPSVQRGIIYPLLFLGREGLVILMLLSYLFLTTPEYIYFLGFPIIALITFFLYIRSTSVNLGKTYIDIEKSLISIIKDHFSSYIASKFGEFSLKRQNQITDLQKTLKSVAVKNQLIAGLPKTIFEFVIISAVLIIIFFSLQTDINSNLDLAGFVALIMVFVRLLPSIGVMNSNMQALLFNKDLLFNLMNKLQDIDPKITKRGINTQSSNTSNKSSIKINFDKVSFKYEFSKEIIKDFSFAFESGKIYGIKGPSGTGKSTFLYLTLGLLKPDEGSIIINDLTADKWMQQNSEKIQFMQQNPVIFSGTLSDNLNISKSNPAKLNQALEYLNMVDLKLDRLDNFSKDFIETDLKDGKQLSGGQIQKIALIRAILENSSVLVLDEPTSSCDTRSQEKILNLISSIKEDKIIFLISHNKNAFDIADVVLEKSTNSFTILDS